MNLCYVRCQGTELHTEGGDIILDFLSDYCVHNTGHNHPDIIQAIHEGMFEQIIVMNVPQFAATAAALSWDIVTA